MTNPVISTRRLPLHRRLVGAFAASALVGFGLLAQTPPTLAQPKTDDIKDLLASIEANKEDSFKQDERQRDIRAIARLGTPQAVTALLQFFDDPYEHIRETTLLALAGGGRRGPGLSDDDAIKTLIERGLSHNSLNVRTYTADLLGRLATRPAVKEHAPLIAKHADRERDPEVQRMLYSMLGDTGSHDKDVLASLIKAAKAGRARGGALVGLAKLGKLAEAGPLDKMLKENDVNLRVGVLDAAAIGAPAEELAALIGAAVADTKGRDYQTRIAALEAAAILAEKNLEAAVPLVVSSFADSEWRVRATAIEAAAHIWDKRFVDALIERLGAEDGRLRLDAYLVLRYMTEKEFGLEISQWKTWWNAQRDRFTLKPKPKPNKWGFDWGDLGKGAVAGNQGGTSAAYFDIPIVTTRSIFCFDPSGSMKNPATDDPNSPRKIDYSTERCIQVLAKLPEKARFNIMVYRYYSGFPPKTEVQRAFNALTPANDRTVKTAKEFVRTLDVRGWGDFYGAFVAAIADPEVDTVFFLSDGVASRGKWIDNDELITGLRAANRFRRVTLHTVLTGAKNSDATFMRNVAIATNGLFKMVDMKDSK